MEGQILESGGQEKDSVSVIREMRPENRNWEEGTNREGSAEDIMAGSRKAEKLRKNVGEVQKREKFPDLKEGAGGADSVEEAIRQIRRDMQKEQYDLQCQYAVGIVEAKVKILDEQLAMKHHREIVRSVTGRIKTPESIYAKLVRKGQKPVFETAKSRLNDLVGVRIVCLFLDDVYEIANSLKKQKDITVVKEKDYIAKPKKNGYMSLHLIVDIPVCFEEAQENKRVEIQIRTLAMDFWSVLEYQLMYKKNISGSEKAARELRNYSEEIAAMDRKMLRLRNQIDEI